MAWDDPEPAAGPVGKLLGAGILAGVLVAAMAFPAIGGVALTARGGARYVQSLPDELRPPPLPQRSTILAADGSKIATFFYQNRISVPLNQIARVMRRAIIAIEDSRFYQHEGIDPQGMARAAVVNLRRGRVVQGGSTITQQYVENIRLLKADTKEERQAAHAQTVAGKLREIQYALELEDRLTKKQILQGYLNIAYFGEGAYGVEVAARHYFDKHASELTLPEAALLAGVVKAPSRYNPIENPEAAKRRRNVVITRMAELGMISAERAEEAKSAPLGLDVREMRRGCGNSKAPFFCVYVLNEIKTSPAFGQSREQRVKLLRRGGLTVHTTLKWDAQQAAQEALRDYVPPGESNHKAAAEAMIEPGTGKIRALAVSLPFGDGAGETMINLAANKAHGGNNGAQAGSAFKPYTLATALSEGLPFGYSIYAPQEITVSGYEDCQGNVFPPYENVGNAVPGEAGTYNLKTGTWLSINTFFVQLEKRVELCDAVKTARELGLHTASGKPIPVVPSFTLGTARVAPLDMAAAYAVFAARGMRCDPVAITKALDRHGNPLGVPDPKCKRVLQQGVADAVNYVLKGVLNRGTAEGSDIPRPAAGKTGTTDDYSAAWFVGYTPELAAAVWVGDPRGGGDHPLEDVTIGGQYYDQVYGATIPAPIWQQSMRQALAGSPQTDFRRPPSRFFSTPAQQGPEEVGPTEPPEDAVDGSDTFSSPSPPTLPSTPDPITPPPGPITSPPDPITPPPEPEPEPEPPEPEPQPGPPGPQGESDEDGFPEPGGPGPPQPPGRPGPG